MLLRRKNRTGTVFFSFFWVMLIVALIERELRLAMKWERIESLPSHPEFVWPPIPLQNSYLDCSVWVNGMGWPAK